MKETRESVAAVLQQLEKQLQSMQGTASAHAAVLDNRFSPAKRRCP